MDNKMVNSTSIETDIVPSLLNKALESNSKTNKQFDPQILQKLESATSKSSKNSVLQNQVRKQDKN
jgi:hypothetical protein